MVQRLFAVALVFVLVANGIAFSNEADSLTGWKKQLNLSLNVTQSQYSDSWTGGEVSNVTWVGTADGKFEKQVSEKFYSATTVKLAFGQTHNQDRETKVWDKPVKSNDKIDIESVGRFTFNWFVDPYAALRFESQFLDASGDSIKKLYINPVLVTVSSGFAKKLWKRPEKDELLTRLGLALKRTSTRRIVDSEGNTNTFSSNEGGLESVTDLNVTVDEKVNITSKLSLFKAFYNSKKDDFKGAAAEDYWKAVDVNFETTVAVSVTSLIQVTFYTQLLYDKEVSLKGRFKETLALGITYKLL